MSDWYIIVPEGTDNEIINPSFEINITDGWLSVDTGAGAVFARSTDRAWMGIGSGQITAGNANAYFNSDTIALANNSTIYAQVRVYAPTAAVASLRIQDVTTPANRGEVTNTLTDEWELLQVSWTNTTGGAVNIRIRLTNLAGDNVTDVWFDAAQAEIDTTTYTTYCDGDRRGCEWLGTPHASVSRRSALSRAGGVVKDLQDDYHFNVSNMIGTGMPPQTNYVDSYAILPGGQLNSIKTQSRVFTLVGFIQGDDLNQVHDYRQELLDVLKKDAVPPDEFGYQPVLLRYTGADVEKEIAVHYEAGLEANFDARQTCWEMPVAIRFLAPDPFWYEIGESAVLLDTTDPATFRYIAGRLRDTGQWDDLNVAANPTGGGIVYTILRASDGLIYIGGGFTGWNNVFGRDYVASYDPLTDTWATVGGAADFNGTVYKLVEGPDGTIYAGGTFQNCAGVLAADYIAQWDGANWTAVGVPLAGAAAITDVRDMAFDGAGDLYIVGQFTTWANVANADYITRWDGANYWAVGIPVVGGAAINFLRAVAVDSDDNVYVGGSFLNFANDPDADNFAWWDGSAWSDLGGPFNTSVYDITITPIDEIYAGGAFTTINAITHNRIARWDGTSWLDLGNGIPNNQCYVIKYAPDGSVYVGGSFTNLGTGLERATSFVRWNGTIWEPIDVELPTGTPSIRAIETGSSDPVINVNYDLFVGFDQTGAGTLAGTATAEHDGSGVAKPRIVISRTGGTIAQLISIRNETNGYAILSTYFLVDGEVLTIELMPARSSVNSVPYGNRIKAILSSSDMGRFGLQDGNNQVTAFIDTDSTVEAYMVWRDTYESHDK